MANSFNVVFYDDTITNDPATISQWLTHTQFIHPRRLHHLVISLDVEWWRGMQYPVAVLPICVGRRCIMYQMLYYKYIPYSFVRFISNPRNTFVGVGVKDDLIKLDRDYGFGDHAKFLDLRELAASAYDRTELRQAGLKSRERDGQAEACDTVAQVRYACLDAFVSFEIGRIIANLAPLRIQPS